MLSYLILTTSAILMAAVILGVIWGYTVLLAGRLKKYIVLAFICLGFLGSIVIAWFRNATSKLDSAILNGYIYSFSLLFFLLFIIFSQSFFAKNVNDMIALMQWICLAVISITLILYALPEVLGYPYHVYLTESTFISTDFLLSMIGMLFGVILAAVTFIAVQKCTRRLTDAGAHILLCLELCLNAAMRVSGLYSVLFQKKKIKSNHALFTYTVFVKNNSDLFIFASLLLVVAVSILL